MVVGLSRLLFAHRLEEATIGAGMYGKRLPSARGTSVDVNNGEEIIRGTKISTFTAESHPSRLSNVVWEKMMGVVDITTMGEDLRGAGIAATRASREDAWKCALPAHCGSRLYRTG